eukprot:SAG11_NODE_819_length_7017_cov_3.801821_4_plen_66_part_00
MALDACTHCSSDVFILSGKFETAHAASASAPFLASGKKLVTRSLYDDICSSRFDDGAPKRNASAL